MKFPRFTHIIAITMTAMFVFALAGCSDKEEFTITGEQLGSLNVDNTLNPHFKFVPANHQIGLAMEIENHTGENAEFEAVWQYRELGVFHEIMRTPTMVKPGANTISFVLDSNQDLFRGEYMVDVYHGESLEAGHRFWVVSEDKLVNDDINIYKLAACSPQAEAGCFEDERCEKIYFFARGEAEDETFVCEAK